MKTAFVASLFVASASAFVPAQQSSSTTALRADYSQEAGVQAPLGFYDPLNVLKDGDIDPKRYEQLRWLELKHGRVSMLAVVGYLVTQAGVRFPGAESIPSGFAALDAVPGEVWCQMIATWTMMEAANQDQALAPWGTGDGPTNAAFKGDFRNGFIDFGWDKQSADWQNKKRALEINQGRAAMMGITGLMIHDKLGNLDAILP